MVLKSITLNSKVLKFACDIKVLRAVESEKEHDAVQCDLGKMLNGQKIDRQNVI